MTIEDQLSEIERRLDILEFSVAPTISKRMANARLDRLEHVTEDLKEDVAILFRHDPVLHDV
jgi:hypothetical protein